MLFLIASWKILSRDQEYPVVQQKVSLIYLSKRIYQYVQKRGLSMTASGFLKLLKNINKSLHESFNFYLMLYLKPKVLNYFKLKFQFRMDNLSNLLIYVQVIGI